MAVLTGPEHVFERTNDRYLELIGGRQRGLALAPVEIAAAGPEPEAWRARGRQHPLPPRLSEEEITLHLAFVVAELGDDSMWNS